MLHRVLYPQVHANGVKIKKKKRGKDAVGGVKGVIAQILGWLNLTTLT